MKKRTKFILIAAAVPLIGYAAVPPELYFGSPAPRRLRLPDKLPEQITAEELEEQDLFVNCMSCDETKSGAQSTLIYGDFVPFKIRNKKQAALAIAAVSDIIGIDDVRSELRYVGGTDGLLLTLTVGHLYLFMQYYEDIPVDPVAGCSISINSKPNGTADELVASWRPGIELETTEPKLTAAEAERIAAKHMMDEPSGEEETELVVSFYADGSPALCWKIWFDPEDSLSDAVAVDAITGEIVYDSVDVFYNFNDSQEETTQ